MGAAAETPQHGVRGTWRGLDLKIRVGLGGACSRAGSPRRLYPGTGESLTRAVSHARPEPHPGAAPILCAAACDARSPSRARDAALAARLSCQAWGSAPRQRPPRLRPTAALAFLLGPRVPGPSQRATRLAEPWALTGRGRSTEARARLACAVRGAGSTPANAGAAGRGQAGTLGTAPSPKLSEKFEAGGSEAAQSAFTRRSGCSTDARLSPGPAVFSPRPLWGTEVALPQETRPTG